MGRRLVGRRGSKGAQGRPGRTGTRRLWLAARLGLVYARVGQLDAALPLVLSAVDARVANYEQSLYLRYLTETHLLAGRHDDAAREAERAYQLTQQRGERASEAWVFWLVTPAQGAPCATL